MDAQTSDTIVIRQSRRVGEIMKDSLALISSEFSGMLPSLLKYWLPPLVAASIVSGFLPAGLLSGSIDSTIEDAQEILRGAPLAILFYLLLAATYISMMVIVGHRLRLLADNTDLTNANEDLAAVFGASWMRVFLTVIVAALAIIVPLLPLVGLLVGIGFALGSDTGMALAAIIPASFALVGFLVWLAVRITLSTTISSIEDGSPIDAVRRSFWLTKGNFWRVLGVTILISLVVGFVNFALTTPGTLISGVLTEALGLSGGIGRVLVTAIISFIVYGLSEVLYMFLFFGYGLLYYSLVEEREGVQLGEDIDSIGSGPHADQRAGY